MSKSSEFPRDAVAFLRMGLLTILLALTGSAFLAAQIAEETDPSKVWALIIGISNYTHAEPLTYAATDAQAFSAFLQSPRGGGIQPDHIFTLLEEGASRAAILYEFEQMWDRVDDGHTIFVYMAGHGVTHPKRPIGYFIPSDGDITSLNASAISFVSLAEQMNSGFINARQRIMISDMCHSGLSDVSNLINEYILQKFGTEAEGTFLNLAASGPNESSFELDDLGHGAFTYALLEALNGKAAEGDQVVSARELVSFVQSEVPKFTAFQQNPVANEGFDPLFKLADLEKPGPVDITEEATFLRLLNVPARKFVRAQWKDPASESVAVRLIPPNEESVAIGPLQPGSIELRLFDRENNQQMVSVELAEGENLLKVDEAARGAFRPGRTQVASLAPIPIPLAPLQTAPPFDPSREAQLVMRLETGTDVFVEGEFYARIEDATRPLQIQGLPPGDLQLRLVFSPEHEGRYRLRLRNGPYLFDAASQELRGLMAVEPPPSFVQPPAGLGVAAGQLFRQFMTAIWRDELVQPAGRNAFEYFQQLRGLLTPGQLQEAERNLVVALGDKAQKIILRYLKGGDVRWSRGAFDEGGDLVARFRELFQDSTEYQAQQNFFRGRALLEADQFAQGRQILQQAVGLDPDAGYVHNAIGLSYWRQGQMTQALNSLETAIDLAPRWNYPRITRALIFLEQRRYAESETAFREALSNDPEDSTAHHGLGQLLFLTGRWGEAEQEVGEALRFHPGNGYAYQTLSRIALRTGRVADALDHLQLAIRLEPEEPAFRLSLAQLYQQQARLGEAQGLFDRLLADEPDNAEVMQAFARFNAAAGRHETAESSFQKALRLAPRNANIRVDYGIFLNQQGSVREAERQFRQALDIDSNNAFARFQLASSHWNSERVDQARREANGAIQADPRYYAPYRLLGQIHFALREHDQALEMFRRSRELALEGHQRLELQELIDQIEATIVEEALARVTELEAGRRLDRAWNELSETLRRAPDSRSLRNRILEFQFRYPGRVRSGDLPVHILRTVLESSFWLAQQGAEKSWQEERREEALSLFQQAFERLDGEELARISSQAFNFENEEHGIHQLVYRWGGRLAGMGEADRLGQLLQQSQDRMIFAQVPSLQPITIDSLMRPADVSSPRSFSDFDVAHHPDRRIHELFARRFALSGDLGRALTFVAAWEENRPDMGLRLALAESLAVFGHFRQVREVLEVGLADMDESQTPQDVIVGAHVMLARALCRTGECEAAERLLDEAIRRFPNRPELREARRQLR